jgi:serine/threonine protein kinase
MVLLLLLYNIAPLLCAAQTATRIYVVMEYIRGCTLKALMRAHRARGLPIAALRFWFAEVRLINNNYYNCCVHCYLSCTAL